MTAKKFNTSLRSISSIATVFVVFIIIFLASTYSITTYLGTLEYLRMPHKESLLTHASLLSSLTFVVLVTIAALFFKRIFAVIFSISLPCFFLAILPIVFLSNLTTTFDISRDLTQIEIDNVRVHFDFKITFMAYNTLFGKSLITMPNYQNAKEIEAYINSIAAIPPQKPSK